METSDRRIVKLAKRLEELRALQTKILSFKAKRQVKKELADTLRELRCLGVTVEDLESFHSAATAHETKQTRHEV